MRRRREHVAIVLDDDLRIEGDIESARMDSVTEIPFGGPARTTAVRVVITMVLDPATARVWHRHAVAADRVERARRRLPP